MGGGVKSHKDKTRFLHRVVGMHPNTLSLCQSNELEHYRAIILVLLTQISIDSNYSDFIMTTYDFQFSQQYIL